MAPGRDGLPGRGNSQGRGAQQGACPEVQESQEGWSRCGWRGVREEEAVAEAPSEEMGARW